MRPTLACVCAYAGCVVLQVLTGVPEKGSAAKEPEDIESPAAWPTPLKGLTTARRQIVSRPPLVPGSRIRVLHPPYSEHHQLDVLPGEDRACRHERVAADDEVLGEGVDVPEPTLQGAVGVQGRSAAGAVCGGDY